MIAYLTLTLSDSRRPQQDWLSQAVVPTLAPPPKTTAAAFQDSDPPDGGSLNPFAPSSGGEMKLDLQLQTARGGWLGRGKPSNAAIACCP